MTDRFLERARKGYLLDWDRKSDYETPRGSDYDSHRHQCVRLVANVYRIDRQDPDRRHTTCAERDWQLMRSLGCVPDVSPADRFAHIQKLGRHSDVRERADEGDNWALNGH